MQINRFESFLYFQIFWLKEKNMIQGQERSSWQTLWRMPSNVWWSFFSVSIIIIINSICVKNPMQVATSLTTRELFRSLTSTTITTTLQLNSFNSRFNQTSTNLSSIETKQHIQLNYPALGIFLSFFCFITVFGNGLVIYAIVQERYLKSGRIDFFIII